MRSVIASAVHGVVPLFAALLLAACTSTIGAAGPGQGLAESEAVSMARAQATGPTTGVLAARAAPFHDIDPTVTDAVFPSTAQVWAITFSGSFDQACGPAPESGVMSTSDCPTSDQETVVIDFLDGKFVEAVIGDASGQ